VLLLLREMGENAQRQINNSEWRHYYLRPRRTNDRSWKFAIFYHPSLFRTRCVQPLLNFRTNFSVSGGWMDLAVVPLFRPPKKFDW